MSSTGSPAGTMIQMTRGVSSCRDDVGEILRRRRAELLILRDDRRIAIEGDDRVPVAHEPLDHVAAHLAEADHRELHMAVSW